MTRFFVRERDGTILFFQLLNLVVQLLNPSRFCAYYLLNVLLLMLVLQQHSCDVTETYRRACESVTVTLQRCHWYTECQESRSGRGGCQQMDSVVYHTLTLTHLHRPPGKWLACYPSHATTKTNRICYSAKSWCNVICSNCSVCVSESSRDDFSWTWV